MTAWWVTADVRQALAAIPDGSIDLVLTSPPFLALRSYLPAGHPDKALEIGSEATPAEFLATLLALTDEFARVLAPHGSIAVELGDTYSGSGGAGGDYNDGGLRDGQPKFKSYRGGPQAISRAPDGWPLDKSVCLIPQLYAASLSYGRNLLTGDPCRRWRVRNVVAWVRPNPPVGALGDKFRPATSFLTVACQSRTRWFDLDAVREPWSNATQSVGKDTSYKADPSGGYEQGARKKQDTNGGAPPLDWWCIPPGGYSGKTVTIRREPCGPHDGGERTTSPDCPVHADRPGQLPKALRDARAGTRLSRTSRSDDHLALELPLGSESNDANHARSGSFPDPRSEQPGLEGSGAASPHDNGSNRTGHAPETSQPGTPSSETAPHSARTSASLESGGRRLGTSESSTSAAGSVDSPASKTAAGTAGTDTGPAGSEACTCSYSREVSREITSHYAVFPPELLVRPIKAMCPHRVCTTCGEPSRRITEEPTELRQRHATFAETLRTARIARGMSQADVDAVFGFNGMCSHWERRITGPKSQPAYPTPEQWRQLQASLAIETDEFDGLIEGYRRWKDRDLDPDYRAEIERTRVDGFYASTGNDGMARVGVNGRSRASGHRTVGWTDCGHGTWRPGRVLDPFGGSGTTAAVATGHGRDCLSVDLDARNADLAAERVGMWLTEIDVDDIAGVLDAAKEAAA